LAFAVANRWISQLAYVIGGRWEDLEDDEIMRCLKRYIAREVYATLRDDLRSLSPTP